MNAQGLCVDGDFIAVTSNHCAALHDIHCLASGFGGIADERVIELARAQRSIRLVAAIGESFRSNGEASFTKNIKHRRSG